MPPAPQQAIAVASPPPNLHSQTTPEPVPLEVLRHEPAASEPRVDWRSVASERAAMALTAGDGAGLRLVSVTGTVVIADPLAFSELHLTFENPEARTREGRFEFDLPPGAALSRLAMEIAGRWMEGEVVERRRGQRTFESYIHWRPKVDPALLEQAAANRVSARVFPILPRERKQIVVSYSQPLASSDRSVRLPLGGLPQVEQLDLRVVVRHGDAPPRVIEVREHDRMPTHDLVVSLDGSADAGAVTADELAVVRVRPSLQPGFAAGPEALGRLTVLFDSSASTGAGFEREVDRLGELLDALGDAPVRVIAFDQTVELIHDGPAGQALGAPLARLRERRALGASDLEAALTHDLIREGARERLLIWSDGEVTAGEVDPLRLAATARRLGRARVDAYASTTSADRGLLASLTATGTRGGVVLGPDLSGPALLDGLRRPSLDATRIQVEGAVWSYPATLVGAAPGADVVVYARFPERAPSRVRVGFSDPRLIPQEVATVAGPAPLIERSVARARVDELQRRLDKTPDPAAAELLRDELIELAVANRLLTRHTALLVLESGAEYQRFGIRRRARADILGVGPEGVVLLPRGDGPSRSVELDEAEEAAIAAVLSGEFGPGETSRRAAGPDDWPEVSIGGRAGGPAGAGQIGLGHVGFAAGPAAGFGGHAAGFGGHPRAVPRVRASARPKVDGALDRDLIRRIVRAHINEVRSCYNAGLTKNPQLRGRVEVQFAILGTGKVGTASIVSTTVKDANVNICIAKAFKRWTFPKPQGGAVVRVSYPIDLDPGVTFKSTTRTRKANSSSASSWDRPRDPWSMVVPNRGWSQRSQPDPRWTGSPHAGRYGSIMTMSHAGQPTSALAEAWAWAEREPENLLALVALGAQLERQDLELAARVYGSLIDLHPHRPDLRRAAGERLAALGEYGRALAIDSFRKAVEQRPDHINGHRLLAWALVEDGRLAEAFELLERAIATPIPAGRFRGAKSLMREDLRLIAAAALARGADPALLARIEAAGVEPATSPSLRLAANWETDATDVDLLVEAIGPGAGRRHADVQTGYGPEAWIARGERRPTAVRARVRYFNRRAMGFALGTVTAIEHDGAGELRIRSRPFVLMKASGSEELGQFGG